MTKKAPAPYMVLSWGHRYGPDQWLLTQAAFGFEMRAASHQEHFCEGLPWSFFGAKNPSVVLLLHETRFLARWTWTGFGPSA